AILVGRPGRRAQPGGRSLVPGQPHAHSSNQGTVSTHQGGNMMNTVPWSPSLWPAAACEEALAQLGFAPVAGGYQHGEFRLTLGPHWCALEAPCANPGDDLLGDLSQPGLWKHCRADEQPPRLFA